MKKNYFKGVVKTLKTGSSVKSDGMDFITLKSYEYWIRTLKVSRCYPDADDCIAIFSREKASKILRDLSNHFEKLNEAEDRLPEMEKQIYVQETNDNYAGKRIGCENNGKSVAYQRRQKAIVRFNDVISRSCSVQEISEFVRNYLNGEGIFDGPSQKVFYGSIARELLKALEENTSVNDGYFKRLNIVQQTFGLNATEMEILMFTWIFFNKEQCCSLSDGLISRKFRSTSLPDVFTRLYPELDFDSAVTSKGTLKRMGIMDNDMGLSKRIGMFLDGHSGNDLDSLFFKTYEGDCVPFKKLCRNNPKVELAFDMLKHAKVGEGLNIFFYGVEGTGKTQVTVGISRNLTQEATGEVVHEVDVCAVCMDGEVYRVVDRGDETVDVGVDPRTVSGDGTDVDLTLRGVPFHVGVEHAHPAVLELEVVHHQFRFGSEIV